MIPLEILENKLIELWEDKRKVWKDERIKGRINERMKVWKDERIKGRKNERMKE